MNDEGRRLPELDADLRALVRAGLVTEQERREALSHQHATFMVPWTEDPGLVLAWMVARGLLADSVLRTRATFVRASATRGDQREIERILARNDELQRCVDTGQNAKHFHQLEQLGLISSEIYAEARARAIPFLLVMYSAGETLGWLARHGLVSAADMDDFKRRANAPGAPPALWGLYCDLTDPDAGRARLDPPFRWHDHAFTLLVAVLFAGSMLHQLSNSVWVAWGMHDCTSEVVRQAVQERVESLSFAPVGRLAGAGSPNTTDGWSTRVSEVREIGRAPGESTMACLAYLGEVVGERSVAFTVTWGERGVGSWRLANGDVSLLRLRFSQIDADGRFSNFAEPMGRAALIESINTAIEERIAAAADRSQENPDGRQAKRRIKYGAFRVRDLEPTEACAELEPGLRYRCRNQIDWIGDGGRTLRRQPPPAEATFERGSTTDPWRVTDEFLDAHFATVL